MQNKINQFVNVNLIRDKTKFGIILNTITYKWKGVPKDLDCL